MAIGCSIAEGLRLCQIGRIVVNVTGVGVICVGHSRRRSGGIVYGWHELAGKRGIRVICVGVSRRRSGCVRVGVLDELLLVRALTWIGECRGVELKRATGVKGMAGWRRRPQSLALILRRLALALLLLLLEKSLVVESLWRHGLCGIVEGGCRAYHRGHGLDWI